MINSSVKYVHNEITHNTADPGQLVPLFIKLFSPKSVCDVGCGTGNFLYFFKTNGINKIFGYDGAWVNKQLLTKYLKEKEFAAVDFETELPAPPKKKYDIVLNLEVAEHISAHRAEHFIDFLTSLSDTIIFSAALPGQGGFNHINEQWEEYWEKKFNLRYYKKFDIIRYQIINIPSISWWYRQNIVVYSRKDLSHHHIVNLPNIIMKENYINKLIYLHDQNNFIAQVLNKKA